MQAAFGFACALPASRAGIRPWLNRRSAVEAADTGVVAIVQGVVRDPVVKDVFPNLAICPVSQRVEFEAVALAVPLHLADIGAGGGLFPTHPCNPSGATGQSTIQGLHLADVAAEVGVRAIQFWPVLSCLLFRGKQGLEDLQLQVGVARQHLLPQL
jgi:hypothetical protein